jgi:hypothetical protein
MGFPLHPTLLSTHVIYSLALLRYVTKDLTRRNG